MEADASLGRSPIDVMVNPEPSEYFNGTVIHPHREVGFDDLAWLLDSGDLIRRQLDERCGLIELFQGVVKSGDTGLPLLDRFLLAYSFLEFLLVILTHGSSCLPTVPYLRANFNFRPPRSFSRFLR